jgi:hypothetical protein
MLRSYYAIMSAPDPNDPEPDPKKKRKLLPRLRFHDLRHSAATLLLAQGVHARYIMELLGHSSITLTMNTYGHVLEEMQRETARQTDAVFLSADLSRGHAKPTTDKIHVVAGSKISAPSGEQPAPLRGEAERLEQRSSDSAMRPESRPVRKLLPGRGRLLRAVDARSH